MAEPSAPAATTTQPQTQTQTASASAAKVIAFSGPKGGVGKTQIVLNAAAYWANVSTKRPVLILSLDPLCRNEVGPYLGIDKPESLADLLKIVGKDPSVVKLLKGRIKVNPQLNVGYLPLAHKRQDALKISPEMILPVLAGLSESYDLFLDVDTFFPIQLFAFDLADVAFWVVHPQNAHLQASGQFLVELKNMHFALDRIEVLVNQSNLPGAAQAPDIEKYFSNFGRKVLAYLPWENDLPKFSNRSQLIIADPQGRSSQWIQKLKPVVTKINEIKPMARSWAGIEEAGAMMAGADMLWGTQGGATAAGGDAKKAAGPAISADMEAWNKLKESMHKEVVKAMETEHVRVNEKDPTANAEARKKVEEIIGSLLQQQQGLSLTREQRAQFSGELLDEILGLGPLDPLLRNPALTEIMVNAWDRVYIEQSGKLVLSPVKFRDNEQVEQVIKRIVAPLGRRIDESVPLVDARTKEGFRVNAIIEPLAISGPTLTIRKFSSKPLQASTLVERGSISQDMVDFLRNCVIMKRNIIIAGGTGTGKTTFLNLLSGYIPEDERIITVEDTAELKLLQDHWVRLESRPPNIEGKGEITIRDLVKNCLRMRPDRIVVGECRGAEALDMLQAMNTGHEGSLATIHANTPKDALGRLEAMCLMAGTDLPMIALREMICSAVHMFVQLTRFQDGTRKITYVTEVTGRSENSITTQHIFRYLQTGVDPASGKVLGRYVSPGNVPKFHHEFKNHGLDVPLRLFDRPTDLTPDMVHQLEGK